MPIAESILLEGPLASFLRSRQVERGGQSSVTGMGTIKGRWMIKDEEYTQFIDLLHNYLFVQNLRPLNLVEQRMTNGRQPGLIDLDFKYPLEGSITRRFNGAHISKFLSTYVEQLETFFDLNKTTGGEPILFFISLRPSPYESKKDKAIKDGIHIQYNLTLPFEYQLAIRHKLMESDIIKTAFANTQYTNAEKDIYDEVTIRNGAWFFYGESKPEILAYSLVQAYSYNTSTRVMESVPVETFSSRELMETLSVRYNLREHEMVVREEQTEAWAKSLEAVQVKRSNHVVQEESTAASVEKVAETFPTWLSVGYTDDEVELAKALTEGCLSAERATGYQTWREVGWCLYEISSTEEMFDCWMNFSAKSTKFQQTDVHRLRREWQSGYRSRPQRLTIRSLHLWAKNDNPVEYKRLMDENLVEFVLRHVNNTHNHVARLMQRMFWGDFRASVNSKNTEWFEFKNNCWQKSPQAIEFRNKMSTDVATLVQRAKAIALRKGTGSTEKREAEYEAAHFKELHKMEGNLYSAGFKDSVIKECIGLFYEDEFSQKLNTNPYLIGFPNGVVNLRAERIGIDGSLEYYCEFRPGKPEDYISFQAGRWSPKQTDPYHYVPYREDDPEQAEIDDFMAKVFPRPDLRAYMWRKLASCLEGTNKEQKYDTWIGIGGNGKSKLVDLMSMALGDYAVSLQSTVLTRKRPDSGAANPDIMAVLNKRFIYMAEPDDGEPLNTSRMKQFTGEDAVEARGLFEDQRKFQIAGKMFMLCNKFPAVHAMDRGTWRRIMAVPFESKFVDRDSEEGKDISPERNIWPRDGSLDIKLKRWRVAFMARLVHVYETQYLKQGIEPIPAIVRQESDNYRSMFDSFGKFKQARFRTEAGSEAGLKEIWRVYKQWAEMVGAAGGKKLSMIDLQKRLDDEFGVPADKKTYRRVRLFESDEDLEEYERELAEEEGSRLTEIKA